MSSIYIPFVDCDADETFMGAVLGLAKLGEIERIDFVMHRQQQRRSAYVHFVNRCEGTGFWLYAFRGALDRGECVKIFHGHRKYWKCMKSHAKKPAHERRAAPEMQDGLAIFEYLCSLHPQWNRQQDGTLVFGPRAWAEASGRTYATNEDEVDNQVRGAKSSSILSRSGNPQQTLYQQSPDKRVKVAKKIILADPVAAKKRIHELEENNARLEKKHAEEKKAHAATKKELAWEKEARIADVKEWKAWHARNIPRVDRVLAEEKEKNASLKKRLVQSNKANEDLCARLYSAKEKNAETNRMLSDLAKVSDKQDKPQITET